MTTDPGELYFYIKWEGDKAEPGLIKAKEAYSKIPNMCLKFYEKHLVWDKMAPKPAAAEVKDPKTEQSPEGGSESNNKDPEGGSESNNKESLENKEAPTEAVSTTQETKIEDGDELDDDFPAPVPAEASLSSCV